MVIPSFFYNHLSIGYGKRNDKYEHVADISSNVTYLYSWQWNTNVNYNFNFVLNNMPIGDFTTSLIPC
jgi:hypothetical protein